MSQRRPLRGFTLPAHQPSVLIAERRGKDKGGAKEDGGDKAAAEGGGGGARSAGGVTDLRTTDPDGLLFVPGVGTTLRTAADGRIALGASHATSKEAIARLANAPEGEMVDLMAECALLLKRPTDAAALLMQLTEPPAKGGGGGGGLGGGAPVVVALPPLRLSLLAAAWQCAGELGYAAEASARALSLAAGKGSSSLQGLSAEQICLFWVRRGHLLVAMARPVDAVEAYERAVDAHPDDAAAAEGLAWAHHLCGAGDGAHGHNNDRTLAAMRPLSDTSDVSEYERLTAAYPWSARCLLHYAHVLWRRKENYLAASSLAEAARLTASAQPALRCVALAVRALTCLSSRNLGEALLDLNESLSHVATQASPLPPHPPLPPPPPPFFAPSFPSPAHPLLCASCDHTQLDELQRCHHPLPNATRQLVHFVRGTCLLRIHDVPSAVVELEKVDVRDALPPAEADAIAIAGASAPVVAGGKGAAFDETEARAVGHGLLHRRRLAETCRLHLGFSAAFNLGLGYWRLCRPADALVAFLNAQASPPHPCPPSASPMPSLQPLSLSSPSSSLSPVLILLPFSPSSPPHPPLASPSSPSPSATLLTFPHPLLLTHPCRLLTLPRLAFPSCAALRGGARRAAHVPPHAAAAGPADQGRQAAAAAARRLRMAGGRRAADAAERAGHRACRRRRRPAAAWSSRRGGDALRRGARGAAWLPRRPARYGRLAL